MFRPFLEAAPPTFAPRVIGYPPNEIRTYAGLAALVTASLPASDPFILLGESFGGPLALRVAAARPPGLVAVVLVATFVRGPVAPWVGRFRRFVTGSLFSFPVPVLYIGASREALLRPGIAEELEAHRRDLEIVSVPGPHLVLQRNPRAAWEHISRFAARVGVRGGPVTDGPAPSSPGRARRMMSVR